MKPHKINPFYWVARIILHSFYSQKLTAEQQAFIKQNNVKHGNILLISTLLLACVFFGLLSHPEPKLLINGLIAPVMITGTAWFAISFGGIPKKLLNIAMSVTFWLFSAFLVSLGTMFLTLIFMSSVYLWAPLLFIFIGIIISCIQYDTTDGLRAGLDEAVLEHSRYAINYYKKEGIEKEL